MGKEESKKRALPPATEPSDRTAWEGFMKIKAQMPEGQLGGSKELSEMAQVDQVAFYTGPQEMPECFCQTLRSSPAMSKPLLLLMVSYM